MTAPPVMRPPDDFVPPRRPHLPGPPPIKDGLLSKPLTVEERQMLHELLQNSRLGSSSPMLIPNDPRFESLPSVFDGMTKRELFAMVALNGILSEGRDATAFTAATAVRAADLLIAALESKQ